MLPSARQFHGIWPVSIPFVYPTSVDNPSTSMIGSLPCIAFHRSMPRESAWKYSETASRYSPKGNGLSRRALLDSSICFSSASRAAAGMTSESVCWNTKSEKTRSL